MMKTNNQTCRSSYWSMVSVGNTPMPCRQHNGKRLYCFFKKMTKKGSVETTGSGHKYIIAQEIKHTYLTSYFSFLLLLIDTYFSLTEAGEIWSTQLRSHFLSGDVFGSYLFDQKQLSTVTFSRNTTFSSLWSWTHSILLKGPAHLKIQKLHHHVKSDCYQKLEP